MADLTDDEIVKIADRVWEEGHISSLSRTTAVIYARAILAFNKAKTAVIGKNYCGKSNCMGQGDYAVCGKPYYHEIYQCKDCQIKDLKR